MAFIYDIISFIYYISSC